MEGWDAFAVGGAIFGGTPGQGTYNLSAGTLNTGYYVTGLTEIGVAGGTGVVNVSGGVWNISADAPAGPGGGGGQGGATLLNIGSGNVPDGDAAGAGSVVISGGQVNAFGGITVGNVYNQGGAGLLSLQGGLLDLTAGTVGALGGKIYVGSGGTLVASSGTLQNVLEILGNVTISGTTAIGTPLPLTVSGSGLLVLAGTNTYTGGTTVTGGTLEFSTPESMPTASILTIQSGGEVVLGDLVDAAPSTADGLPAVADVAADNAGSPSSTIAGAGAISSTSGISALLARIRAAQAAGLAAEDAAGAVGAAAPAASPAAVPEPSTFALLAVAAVGLLAGAWRRRQRPQ